MSRRDTKDSVPDAAAISVGWSTEGPAGRAVLVLGPEGAGTALAAGLLGLLGCDLPRDLLATGAADAEEAWASAGLSALAGDGAPDADAARAALDEAFGPAPLPLIKARGLEAGLPGWLAATRATGRGAVAVLVLGAPADTEGADGSWARALLRAERGSRGLRRAVLDRDPLLLDWRGEVDRLAGRLGVAWPARAAAEPACDALVAAATPGVGEARVAGPAALVRDILMRWAAEGEDPTDHPALDRLGSELGLRDPARPTPPASHGAAPHAEAAKRAEPAPARLSRAQLEDALHHCSVEAADHAQARAALAARLGQLDAELAEERAGRAADRHQIDRLTRDLAVLRREAMGELRARLDALPGALGIDRQAADAAQPGLGPAAAPAAAERLRQESSRAADLDRRLAQAERAAEKRRAEAQALAARLKEAERQARDLRAQADAARAEVEGLRRSTSWRLTAPLRTVLGAVRPRRR